MHPGHCHTSPWALSVGREREEGGWGQLCEPWFDTFYSFLPTENRVTHTHRQVSVHVVSPQVFLHDLPLLVSTDGPLISSGVYTNIHFAWEDKRDGASIGRWMPRLLSSFGSACALR